MLDMLDYADYEDLWSVMENDEQLYLAMVSDMIWCENSATGINDRLGRNSKDAGGREESELWREENDILNEAQTVAHQSSSK